MDRESQLTDRQRQCLEGVIARKTAKEIAKDLGITHHGVEKHLTAARRKLGAQDTLQAAAIYQASVATVGSYYCSDDLPSHRKSHLADSCSNVGRERPQPSLPPLVASESRGPVYEFSIAQTVFAILGAVLAIAAALALLIAIAQGVDLLTS